MDECDGKGLAGWGERKSLIASDQMGWDGIGKDLLSGWYKTRWDEKKWHGIGWDRMVLDKTMSSRTGSSSDIMVGVSGRKIGKL